MVDISEELILSSVVGETISAVGNCRKETEGNKDSLFKCHEARKVVLVGEYPLLRGRLVLGSSFH